MTSPSTPGVEITDYVVVGCGIAGLCAAIELAEAGGRVVVLTKDEPVDSNTWEAQGGIAVVLSEEDRVGLHYQDTLVAGDGLCDPEAVRILVEDGPDSIRRLISWGVEFDREGSRLAFTAEGAHSARRVLHAGGDSTGRAVARALLAKARSFPRLVIRPHLFTVDLLLDWDGRCAGMRCLDEPTGELLDLRARAVCLASGGLGRIYRQTTNPPQATGDGMAVALRSGARLTDMEFVQFHPTALCLPGAPTFLLSEALRGEGAFLRNAEGVRFMEGVHERAELAPRDVVSRAIASEVERTGVRCVYLDLTHLDAEILPRRFPTIFQTCLRFGIDLRTDRIPVHPSAHYSMGGVRTDLWGRTDVPGLFAAGEVASCGVHGANRLASNSLLEGLVYGSRAGRAVLRDDPGRAPQGGEPPEPIALTSQGNRVAGEVAETMWRYVGVVRDGQGVSAALEKLADLADGIGPGDPSRGGLEARNVLFVSRAVAEAALQRTESRGAHFRRDFPERDDSGWRRHSTTNPGRGRRPPSPVGWVVSG
jgi:L-aspartate oxidase